MDPNHLESHYSWLKTYLSFLPFLNWEKIVKIYDGGGRGWLADILH